MVNSRLCASRSSFMRRADAGSSACEVIASFDASMVHAALIVERRTGLPICSSKTLLDDSVLVGNTNRLLINVEKVLPEFKLAKFQEMRVKTSSGCLEIILFDLYFILVLLYPDTVDMSTPEARARINEYIEAMRTSI